ncbi:hypothetical protein H012_gp777 [Acanthamoeba polyphaga moumouvirus]|uniref:Uncharacterized protein n=1 Tax=Acanthamoeba polyphaga moumouvirus TaxID=1269028 RepID=L7RCI4_9VIRU|nr:hypothetical protein H012_gp777 [Acanthamoeba polyphaga moumouvirus]AGC01688.1 hypothetical protein Moumou_00144 [Acanthamoeba polyphaga moumouvirus]AQN68026.1 hypothetical protein [Saudi moumouvirus]
MSDNRSFRCIDTRNGESFGHYISQTPKAAASKAFTQMLRNTDNKDKKYIIVLRESTQGSPKKTYFYEGQRIEFDKPQKIKIDLGNGNQKTITYKYRNIINKIEPFDF